MPVFFEVTCQGIFVSVVEKDTHLNDQILVLLHVRSANKLGMIYLFERLH